jgi:hypothetical protein
MNSESLTVVRVITPPCRVDGGVCRVVELSDGGGRVESWIKGRGWVPGGATLKEAHDEHRQSGHPRRGRTRPR